MLMLCVCSCMCGVREQEMSCQVILFPFLDSNAKKNMVMTEKVVLLFIILLWLILNYTTDA